MNAHTLDISVYRRFADLLHRTIGLDAASVGHSAIERAVDLRAASWCAQGHADASLADYWDAAHASPEMVQALVETVIVPETWFYRDADAFKALARLAFERLHERGTAMPIRLLSLPCSTGEEPYTIAMTLFDAGFDAAQFRIDAMDVSERALAVAQRAVYGRNSFRGNAFPFRDTHFSRTEDGWRIAPRIAEAVHFSHANLMQPDASTLGTYDFVFCRNVLIYFDRDAQQTALHTLNHALADNGTLFVGPSETGLLMRHGMQSAKIPLAFAFHRGVPAEAPRDDRHPAPIATAAALAMTRSVASRSMPATRTLPPVFSAQPFAWPDPVARVPFGDNASLNGIAPLKSAPQAPAADTTLKAAHALADAGRLSEAAAAVTAYLKQHPPHADAFYLLGVLADAGGDAAQARAYYRKALYLEPQHAGALMHLAARLDLEGDRDGARLLMQRAARVQGVPRG